MNKLLIAIFLLCAVSLPANANAVVKKSRLNVCYTPESTKYNRVKEYIPYKTLEDCLKSGGRKPKGTYA